MDEILNEYGKLLRTVDKWFNNCMERFPSTVACGSGCSECCRGLFDITLLDAAYLRSGFLDLPVDVRAQVLHKSEKSLAAMRETWPDFSPPFVLNQRAEEEWDALMPDADETPCPLLAADGSCLVYNFRPMTCRLHGFPLVDLSAEIMHDEWCTKNFIGSEPLGLKELRWDFNGLFREELSLFRLFTIKLLKRELTELDTFIPTALMIDFSGFDWQGWIDNCRLWDNRTIAD